jgi:hypothetical protein
MKIEIDIKSCNQCPHFKASPYYTEDSFERPEYWWCTNDDAVAESESSEAERLSIKKYSKLLKLRYIAGYVEWHDKIKIPEWCPCRINK